MATNYVKDATIGAQAFRTLSTASLFALATTMAACGYTAPPSPPLATPAAPAGFQVGARDRHNRLTWFSTGGAVSYNVYRRTTSGGPAELIAVPVTTSHVDLWLANGTTYLYTVRANGIGSEGPPSSEIAATPTAASGRGDPLYGNNWHLKGSTATTVGANVEGAWADTASCAPTGCRGEGQRLVIVDDGVEIAHEDLAANLAPRGTSHDYLRDDIDPTDGAHGTNVAGVAVAQDDNGLGSRGAAPRAQFAAYNYLQAPTTANEADAMVSNAADTAVSINSWGPPDRDGRLYASSASWRQAIDQGLATGRGGKGTVYVWAGGNGGSTVLNGGPLGNSNYDGYANYRGVIAVCATAPDGTHAAYSSPGANLWVCAPSLGSLDSNALAITTTDRSGDTLFDSSPTAYTDSFSGTSAAAPTVGAVAALMLQANPALGWRDVRLILAETARKTDPTNTGWRTAGPTPAGAAKATYDFHHHYGYGLVDGAAAVARSKAWTPIGTPLLSWPAGGYYGATVAASIPDNAPAGVSSSLTITGSGITSVEQIEVLFAANHGYSGDLRVALTSPMGHESVLAETHRCAAEKCSAYDSWVFQAAGHLGEAADGTWTLSVSDGRTGDTGSLKLWGLRIYGR